mgnify:CR=1 FL=1
MARQVSSNLFVTTTEKFPAAADDHTGVVAWSAEAGASTGLVGQSSYESGGTHGVLRYEVWAGGVVAGPGLPAAGTSVGEILGGNYEGCRCCA